MTRSPINTTWCQALFASDLQQSDAPAASAVAKAVSRTVLRFGTDGCASRMAQEFGDHPEAAADRMRWVRQLAGEVSAPAAQRRRPGGPIGHRQFPVRRLSTRAAILRGDLGASRIGQVSSPGEHVANLAVRNITAPSS